MMKMGLIYNFHFKNQSDHWQDIRPNTGSQKAITTENMNRSFLMCIIFFYTTKTVFPLKTRFNKIGSYIN